MCNNALTDKDKAALEMFKHYSNIRFVMLPMFFTTMGAVIFAYWTTSSSDDPIAYLQLWASISGAVISFLFFIYEYRLGKILINVSALLPDSMSLLKHEDLFGPVTVVTLLLYIGSIIFWLHLAYVHS